MARARLRIVTVRDEDILNSEPPSSTAVPAASSTPEVARKAASKSSAAKAPLAKERATEMRSNEVRARQPKGATQGVAPAQASVGESTAPRPAPKERAPKDGGQERKRSPASKLTLVSDVMHKNVVSCTSWEALSSVGQLMWDNNVGVVIVVDAERKPVSVVTDRDLAMAAYTQGIPLAHIGVGTCMSQSIVTCSLDADVGEVVRLMRRHRVRRIAVVDTSGQLAGIVGLSDLFGPSGAPKVGIKPADIVGLLAELLK